MRARLLSSMLSVLLLLTLAPLAPAVGAYVGLGQGKITIWYPGGGGPTEFTCPGTYALRAVVRTMPSIDPPLLEPILEVHASGPTPCCPAQPLLWWCLPTSPPRGVMSAGGAAENLTGSVTAGYHQEYDPCSGPATIVRAHTGPLGPAAYVSWDNWGPSCLGCACLLYNVTGIVRFDGIGDP